MTEKRRLYRVAFMNQGQLYELYVRKVVQGGLLGFVQLEDIVFGEKTRVVVDPGEERLRQEFEGVKRCFVPMHAMIRIDEVEKPGTSRICDGEGKASVAPFPTALVRPPSKD